MIKTKIFIACDTTNITKVKRIINQTKTSEIKIGYKFGTEKFADCVMKMMNSQAETRNQNSIDTGNRDSSAASRASKRRMCSRGGGQC